MGTLTKENCRAAMGLLGWGQAELAARAGVVRMTLSRFLRGDSVSEETVRALTDAIEGAGVDIYAGSRPGVRRRG